jgi:hypothetical protein
MAVVKWVAGNEGLMLFLQSKHEKVVYQHSEGLIKPPIEARDAVEVEALRGFADHAAVLHRVRAYCK